MTLVDVYARLTSRPSPRVALSSRLSIDYELIPPPGNRPKGHGAGPAAYRLYQQDLFQPYPGCSRRRKLGQQCT